MPFDAFANREDPDQAAFIRAAWSGSTLYANGTSRTDRLLNLFNPLPHRDAFWCFCKQRRPRSGSSCKSCLISVYSVCLWNQWTCQDISLFSVPTWNFSYIIIHSGWSLAWIFMKERANNWYLWQQVVKEKMAINDFTIFSSGCHFVWWCGTAWAILVEGIEQNTYLKLFWIRASSSGGKVV